MVVEPRLDAGKALSPATSTILVIGAGIWGSSTALYLKRRGYKHVTVLDPYEVPSAISAGNDTNKIAESANVADAKDNAEWASETVRADAIEAWKNDSVFKKVYHATGYVIAATKPDNVRHLWDTDHPTAERGFTELNDAEAFQETMPKGVLTGHFPRWKGWYKPAGSGWLRHVKLSLRRQGRRSEWRQIWCAGVRRAKPWG